MTSESGGRTLINLGDWSAPATTLIEKVSDAVGGIAKPWQIRRVARAEAEAVPLLSLGAKPEQVENDWLVHFFERCRQVSDKEMQSIWSNILAGEANEPGMFSKKTVDLVATLDKRDARLFGSLCTYVWKINEPTLMVPMQQTRLGPHETDISFSALTHLDSIGLISFNPISGYMLRFTFPEESSLQLLVSYYGRSIIIEFPGATAALQTGCAMLTRAGKELVAICDSVSSEEHLTLTLEGWLRVGYVCWTPVTFISNPPVLQRVV